MLGAGRWSGWGFAEFAARPVHPDPGGNRADAEDRARVSEPHSVERDQFEDCALTAGQRRQPLVQVAGGPFGVDALLETCIRVWVQDRSTPVAAHRRPLAGGAAMVTRNDMAGHAIRPGQRAGARILITLGRTDDRHEDVGGQIRDDLRVTDPTGHEPLDIAHMRPIEGLEDVRVAPQGPHLGGGQRIGR